MDGDYKELIEYLDGKFNKIDEQFGGINERFGGANKELVGIKSQIFDVQETLKTKTDKSDFNELQTSVDSYASKADSYFQEMVMLSHKVDRHEKWFQQVANKLGINLEY